ncbi:MAG: hypothetical protein JSS31_19130 [Proteobacteria bacterium]|nr:hypothetical protein [Pseudomonadota bacterium]
MHKSPQEENLSFSVKSRNGEARKAAPILAFADFPISVKSRNGVEISVKAELTGGPVGWLTWAHRISFHTSKGWATPSHQSENPSSTLIWHPRLLTFSFQNSTGDSAFNGKIPVFNGMRPANPS